MLNLTYKRASVKNYRKGIRVFNGYIANCAQLYAFCKNRFLLRIERKLRRGVLTLVELFDYRGHIHWFNYHIDNRIASHIRELRAISSPNGAESSILYCLARKKV